MTVAIPGSGVVGAASGAEKPSAGTRALQVVVGLLALIPVSAGAAGILLGPDFLGLDPPWPADLDSHFRFLSGIFLAVGIGFYSCVPRIAERGGRFRLLAGLVIAGGLARLWSLGLAGAPSTGHLAGLVMELAVVPLLVAWQARLVATSPVRSEDRPSPAGT